MTWLEPAGAELHFNGSSAVAEPADAVGTVLDALTTFLRRFVVLSPSQRDVNALWIFHTHAVDAADATPYLGLTSAEKRSGKTRLLEVLELLVSKPLVTVNASEAVLFRAIDAESPTLLFDEIDAIFGPKARDREDMRGILNAGYRRGAKVRRVGGPNRDRLDEFSVFCPKAFAGIGSLPDTLADRSIPIRLERRGPAETVERFRRRFIEPDATVLREAVEHAAAQVYSALAVAEPDLPEELDDRAQDVCEPLLAIADVAGGDWPQRARRAVVELCASREPDDDSLGVRLLSDIRDGFGDRDRLTTEVLLANLHAQDEAPWADWFGKPFTARQLAKLLKPYGVHSRTVRFDDDRTAKGFLVDQFKPVWTRYLAPNPSHGHKPEEQRPNDVLRSVTAQSVLPTADCQLPALQAACDVVTDTALPSGPGRAVA